MRINEFRTKYDQFVTPLYNKIDEFASDPCPAVVKDHEGAAANLKKAERLFEDAASMADWEVRVTIAEIRELANNAQSALVREYEAREALKARVEAWEALSDEEKAEKRANEARQQELENDVRKEDVELTNEQKSRLDAAKAETARQERNYEDEKIEEVETPDEVPEIIEGLNLDWEFQGIFNTRHGRKRLYTAPAITSWWDLWKSNKAGLKEAGLTCKKDLDESSGRWIWFVQYWIEA